MTPASRRQDHTTSPSTFARFVKRAISVHRIPSRVRDDREPPLCGTGPDRSMPASSNSSSVISENQKTIAKRYPRPSLRIEPGETSSQIVMGCRPPASRMQSTLAIGPILRGLATRHTEVGPDRPALPDRDHPCKRCRHRCRPSRAAARGGACSSMVRAGRS